MAAGGPAVPSEPFGDPRRLVVVVAAATAEGGAPPGVDPGAFAAACLADSYEVVADLVGVTSGIAGDGPVVADLLWPGARQLTGSRSVRELVAAVEPDFDEVVLVPADVPDLPGLVLAKVFKALQRADVCVAPERGSGGGCAALGLRLPWPTWLLGDLDLDHDPREALQSMAPQRGLVATAPDWHRMRTVTAVQRLDPGLEGWETTRALLSGRPLGSSAGTRPGTAP
jgi:hypothetical protein